MGKGSHFVAKTGMGHEKWRLCQHERVRGSCGNKTGGKDKRPPQTNMNISKCQNFCSQVSKVLTPKPTPPTGV